ncbi:MAG: hypothetical protein JO295_12520 [Verrucomicrobia bacterium]|nr:hypothetical protein [Verrucomicrobiota bacterium]
MAVSSKESLRDIEYRALRLLERLGHKQQDCSAAPEDVFSACFHRWPGPARVAARQLAAHANAARGRDLLWLIGIGSGGAKKSDCDAWLAGLRSWFDGLMPRVVPVEMTLPTTPSTSSKRKLRDRSDRPLIALHIETDRAPFVIRAGSGNAAVRLETPWLDLTATSSPLPPPRSATRTDLIKLLTPLLDLPRFELLEAQLAFYANPHVTAYARTTFRWSLDAALYAMPMGENARVVLPLHRCRGGVEIGADFHNDATEFNVTPDKASPAVRVTESAVLIDGLGRLFLYLCGATQQPQIPWQEPATLALDLTPTGAERAATVLARLRPEKPTESNQAGLWRL